MPTYQIYPAYPNLACLWLHHNDESTNVVKFNKNFALLGKLISHKTVNSGGFKTVVARAWTNQAPERIIDLGQQRFLFIFRNEDDKLIVHNGGPWWFMNAHLVLKECPSAVFIKEMDFSTSKFWVQAHNIPFEKRKEKLAAKIARVFPNLHAVDFGEYGSKAWDGYVRLLVDIEVYEPLLKGMLFKSQGMDPLWIQFKYERMPYYCHVCGKLGHNEDQCLKRHISSLEHYGSELRALPSFVPTVLPSWKMLQTWIGFKGPIEDSVPAASGSRSRRSETLTKTFVLDLSDDDEEGNSVVPVVMHLPTLIVKGFSSPSLKGCYQTFDSEVHKIGDYLSPPLPQMPVRKPYPDHPTDEEMAYIDYLGFSEEEYKEYKADLEWVPEGGDVDDEEMEVRKLILNFEHISKRKIDTLNEADRSWFEAAREFCKILLQKWAYPVETGVWDITLVGQFERPQLMAALFD